MIQHYVPPSTDVQSIITLDHNSSGLGGVYQQDKLGSLGMPRKLMGYIASDARGRASHASMISRSVDHFFFFASFFNLWIVSNASDALILPR